MAGAMKNKARNQLKGGGKTNAQWLEGRTRRNRKLLKQQKASRSRNR